MGKRATSRASSRRAGKVSSQAMMAVVVILVLAAFLVYRVVRRAPNGGFPRRPAAGVSRGDFPEMANKPKPTEAVFKGCPPEGDGGDSVLNRLKNRVDEPSEYRMVPFETLVSLPWPPEIERRYRDRWSVAENESVSRYEGVPVSVEGYLAGARREGEESCNCHGADDDEKDFHVWLTQNAHEDRSGSIVVEVTPRLRIRHPGWTTDRLGRIAGTEQRVLVGGWLMLDPEHPDQVGKTRGTLWEIHPITRIDVDQGGRWVPLDSLSP